MGAAGHGVLAAGLAALDVREEWALWAEVAEHPPELELLETIHPQPEGDAWRVMYVYKVTGAHPGRLLVEAPATTAIEPSVGNYIPVQPVFSEDIAGPTDAAGPSRWILRPAAGQITVEVLASDPYDVAIEFRFE